MLQRIRKPRVRATPARIAIVASEYNRRHVDGLLDGALGVLREAETETEVFRVPGAFEIPVVVETLAAEGTGAWSAILCLGVIIRGETAHADLVGGAVTHALMDTAVRRRVPVVHEVLLVASRAQADARCLDAGHNRGVEAARTALAMARLMPRMPGRRRPAAAAAGKT
jgi:6,7-dimethyl-8-ribityllumazine synthase